MSHVATTLWGTYLHCGFSALLQLRWGSVMVTALLSKAQPTEFGGWLRRTLDLGNHQDCNRQQCLGLHHTAGDHGYSL